MSRTDFLRMGIQPSGSDHAYIDHFCLGLASYNTPAILARLDQKDVSCEGEAGEDPVRFFDLDGLLVQLSSTGYARQQTPRG